MGRLRVIGGGRGGGAGSVSIGADFTTSTTVGTSAQPPPGWTFTRASTRPYVRSGTSSLVTLGTPAPTNVAMIGQVTDARTRGLWLEPAATSVLPNGRALGSWSLDGTATLTSGQTGPDGAASAFLLNQPAAVANGILQGYTEQGANVVGVLSVWVKAGSLTAFQAAHFNAATQMMGGAGILSSSWQLFQSGRLRLDQNASPLVILGEVQDLSTLVGPSALPFYLGQAAQQSTTIINPKAAENVLLGFVVLEVGASYATTYVDLGTPRAAESLSAPAAFQVNTDGSVEFEITFTPEWSIAQLQASTTSYLNNGAVVAATVAPNPCLFWQDANNNCEIDVGHGQIRLVVAGSPVVYPTLPPFANGTSTTVHVKGGNGAASGWYTLSGGARVDLGTEAVSQPPWSPGSATMFVGCRSTAGFELGGTIQKFGFVRSN